jgi:Uncharacterized protein conserved in bacteria (DUF2332)
LTESNLAANCRRPDAERVTDTTNNDRLRALLHSFVQEVQSSPLYMGLCPLLAETPSAVELLVGATPLQRRPNLLLAAMHASLLRNREHPLAEWYPTVGGSASSMIARRN